MTYRLEFTDIALEDIEQHKKSGNQAVLRKLEQLFIELIEHPKTGTGRPERLKGDLEALYSRRINKQHRLVYAIKDEIVTVLVLAAWSHYGDK